MVIYFSRAGQNKQHGEAQYINIGNTELLAQKIATQLQSRAVPIVPQISYPVSYEETLKLTQVELSTAQQIAIHTLPIELADVQQIFLGFPVWWSTLPQAVVSFLVITDLAGKQIYPFCTHEGSGFGQSLARLHELVPEATIETGLAVRGSSAYKADVAVKNWLHSIKMEKSKGDYSNGKK
ncbi:flavodoxin [Lapidilactobacillus mulanensis]|uniref:Flavodoxin n=1 Tax=Lapidilactobacillus mulanensis TaxID=2485999 RepID=A0ABW4DL03_9LACO|nr:flavodoxin [Lapidilactobacillus mulanensis]